MHEVNRLLLRKSVFSSTKNDRKVKSERIINQTPPILSTINCNSDAALTFAIFQCSLILSNNLVLLADLIQRNSDT